MLRTDTPFGERLEVFTETVAMPEADFGAKRREGTKRLYGDNGNSFVAVVEFGDKVRAKSILVGGQSNDPDSPHFDDQAPRYAAQEFKEVAYYKEDVERRAEERYRPGNRCCGASPENP